MKNSNTEYKNPFLNKINHIVPTINNLVPVIQPKTDNPLNGPLSLSKQARPALKEKLIRHNPAATSEWDCSSYSYTTGDLQVSPVIIDSTQKLASLFFNARPNTKNASDTTKSAMFKHRSILKTFVSKPRIRSSINRARITLYKYNRLKVYHLNMLNKSFTLCPNKKQKRLSVHLPLNSPSKKLVTTRKNPTSNVREESNSKINPLNTPFTAKGLKKNLFSPLAFEKKGVRTFSSSTILLSKKPSNEKRSVSIKPSILYSKKSSIISKKRISPLHKRVKKIQRGKKRILLNILRNKTSKLVLNTLTYSFKSKPSILVFKKVENYSRKLYVKIKSLQQYIVHYAKMGKKKDLFSTPTFVLTTWNKIRNTANTPIYSKGKIPYTSALPWVKGLSGKHNKAKYNLYNNFIIPGLNIGKFVGKLYKRILPSKFHFSILWVHHMKSNNIYLSRLTNILKKRWQKKIALNVVELKYIYLDSNIMADAVTTKLKDRQKRVLRVLKKVLGLIKNPYFKIHFYNKKKTLEQSNVNFLLRDKNLNMSNSSILFFGKKGCNDMVFNKYLFKKPNNHIPRILLYHLKHKIISGVRLVGSGRLTRRLTASRSISKVKYMGSLQNIESSRQAVSTVMLRGSMKSNLQYTNINSYNRNGAFGVKVSVSCY